MTSPSATSSLFFGFAIYFDLLFPAFSGVVSLCNELKDILGALAHEPRRDAVGVAVRGVSDNADDIRLEDESEGLPADVDEDAFDAKLEVR